MKPRTWVVVDGEVCTLDTAAKLANVSVRTITRRYSQVRGHLTCLRVGECRSHGCPVHSLTPHPWDGDAWREELFGKKDK